MAREYTATPTRSTDRRRGRTLRISITLSGLSRLFADDLAAVVAAAAAADEAGIDQIAVPDHLAIGPHLERYPYGAFPLPPEEPWLEPLTLLAAMAGATRRIRLATAVLVAPLRPALLLAKTAATLDVLSRGRLDLGVGLGWQREEFAAAGVPFAGRAARLDDQLRACRALWAADEAVSFRSGTVAFAGLRSLPRPVQPGGPPIWFGTAATPRHAARIAELGTGWMPVGLGLDEIERGVEALRRAFAAAGRDPAELGVRANVPVARDARGWPDLDGTLAGLPRLRAAGVTVAAFALARFARRREELAPLFARLAAARSG
jgi:probable F420-dependent oxidoreductase